MEPNMFARRNHGIRAAKTLSTYAWRVLNAHKMTFCQARRRFVEKWRSLDEYISAKVADKSSGVNTDVSKCAH